MVSFPSSPIKCGTSGSQEQIIDNSNNWREELENNRPSPESHEIRLSIHDTDDDDAITRHKKCSRSKSTPQSDDEQQQQQQQQQQTVAGGQPSGPSSTTETIRSGTLTSSKSFPSSRFNKSDKSLCIGQPEFVDDVNNMYGKSAYAEEEEALEHSAALTAARHAALLARQRANDVEATAGVGSGDNRESVINTCGSGTCGSCLPSIRHSIGKSHEEAGEDELDLCHDDDESDNFFSGICLPRSQFFQTSVICSNTMARDVLVSFTFISKSMTFDTLRENIGEDKDVVYKDHLSEVIGYICFSAALFSAVYYSLKYLR
ncbi:hypothetical protein FBU30_005038 [Linnemannia zychae]|nr:hypothetical protein FBU30_005038 [Linnemannia zychae]